MSAADILDPRDPAAWADQPFELLLSYPRAEVLELQDEAISRRFASLRERVAALHRLASRQGVDHVASMQEALLVFFDHRVLKSYPRGLVEKHDFGRLTTWLDRLTTRDLTDVPLEGLGTVDDWIERLDANGMFLVHSTGTTGKLSFVPRSQIDYPIWCSAQFEARRATTGVDLRTEPIPMFTTSYRHGHQSMVKMGYSLALASAGGDEARHPVYDFRISSELLALAGRLRGAEERGELDQLSFDPTLLDEYKAFIDRGRTRADDIQRWFTKLADEFRGRRVYITGTAGDLVRLALTGRETGFACEFGPDSVLFTGGGMKGFVDPPADWEQLIKDFFGVQRISGIYGMSECSGLAPRCIEDHYHFFPYTVPALLDSEGAIIASEGVQTGRLALFDLLAETYWGGFVTGDRVTVHWDDGCGCGWAAPWIEDDVVRFSELEGGDDKITCAGTAEVYSEFMDYVSRI